MGKLGRFACILTPMLLSIASLICLLVVFLGGLNKGDSNLRSLYYFKADTSQFKVNSTATGIISKLPGVTVDDKMTKLIEGLAAQIKENKLKDVYYIYMWNYCSGDKVNNAASNDTTVTIDFCSPRKAQYHFNPLVEWGLNGTAYQEYIPSSVNSAMSAYRKGSQWMFIAYAIAFWTTAASIIVGLFALCSRVGSCFTAIISGVATLFAILAAITSTVLFSTLVGALGATLRPYDIRLSIGTKMMAVDWLAVAFSVAASMFWLVSMCCCSGKSSDRKSNRNSSAAAVPTKMPGFGSSTSGSYQPIGDHRQSGNPYSSGTYGAHRGVEMQNLGGGAGPYKGRETAYEPFRHG